jgi:hypothetical protein
MLTREQRNRVEKAYDRAIENRSIIHEIVAVAERMGSAHIDDMLDSLERMMDRDDLSSPSFRAVLRGFLAAERDIYDASLRARLTRARAWGIDRLVDAWVVANENDDQRDHDGIRTAIKWALDQLDIEPHDVRYTDATSIVYFIHPWDIIEDFFAEVYPHVEDDPRWLDAMMYCSDGWAVDMAAWDTDKIMAPRIDRAFDSAREAVEAVRRILEDYD